MSRRTRAIRSLLDKRESDVAKQIRDYLIDLGLLPLRQDPSRFRRQQAGAPDYTLTFPGGQTCAIEVKKPGAYARKDEAKQNETLARLRAEGACVIRAHSLEDVANVINIASIGRLRAAWAAGQVQRIASPPEDARPTRAAGSTKPLRLGVGQRELAL